MKTLELEVKFATDDAGTFEGYASVFGGTPDSYGDVIAAGAFSRSLAEHKTARTSPLLLWQHDPAEPIGRWDGLTEDSRGLAVKGRLILETTRGREAYALLKGGALNGLSIGYRVRSASRLPGGGRELRDVDLIEISLVSLPAATAARVTSVKSASAAHPAAKGAAHPKRTTMEEANAPAEAGNDERVGQLEETVAGIGTRLSALEGTVGGIKTTSDRIEAKLNRPGIITETKAAPEKTERKAFAGFLRRGVENLQADEVKALRVADDTAGGYLAPEEFVAEVLKELVEFSPVRQAARVGSTSSGTVVLPKRTGTLTAQWVGETSDREEAQPSYGQVRVPINEAACYVDVSNQLLEDSAVNVEAEVASDLAEEFGRLESTAFVNGDGVLKPSGFMTNADVAFTPGGNASAITSDGLITLMYALPAFYRNRGTWMMNGGTLAAIRRLKDSQGQYLWQPSLQAGQPETILGRPVVEAVDMPDVAANAFPVVFGDFAAAYRIYDRVQLAVMRDPYSVQTKGLVRYHARRRVGGAVVMAEAIRKLRIATS